MKVSSGSSLVKRAGFSFRPAVNLQECERSLRRGQWFFLLTKRPQSFDFSPKHQQSLMWANEILSSRRTTKGICRLFLSSSLTLLDAVRSGGPRLCTCTRVNNRPKQQSLGRSVAAYFESEQSSPSPKIVYIFGQSCCCDQPFLQVFLHCSNLTSPKTSGES